jgi:hypothetical protein
MTPEQYSAAWTRRPSSAVSRLGQRQLLVLSARDLLAAAAREGVPLIALVAPAPAALLGFARAARDAGAPLVVARPSGASGEKGPEEARDDAGFVEAALRAAEEVRFGGPMALLKEPPAHIRAENAQDRFAHEIDAGFTGLALALPARGAPPDAWAAGAAASALELGLELVPSGCGPDEAVQLMLALRARGARPSAVRLTGFEARAREMAPSLQGVAFSSESGGPPAALAQAGVQQLVSGAPFLRALRRASPGPLWERLESFARERGATLLQAAARHQRQLRDLPAAAQDKLEALASYEAAELFAAAGAAGTGARLVAQVGEMSA